MQPPIFIVGTPRSGTTLTARILNRHSGIFIPGETHFFDDLYSKRDTIGNEITNENSKIVLDSLSTLYHRYNEKEDQDRIESLFEDQRIIQSFHSDCHNYIDVFCWFMGIQMQHEKKNRWGNQVPRDLFNANEILTFFPDAKFVICVRDLKDFLLSYKNKWKRASSSRNQKRLKTLYHPIITSILWKSSMNHVRKLLAVVPDENRIVSKYEDLVRFPEESIKKICLCIGEKYEDSMLSITFSNSSFDQKDNGIFSTSIGRWKKDLSPEEVTASQMICLNELKRFGYDIVSVPYSLLRFLSIFLSAPIAFLRGLRANQSLRGSTIKYLIKRIRPLLN